MAQKTQTKPTAEQERAAQYYTLYGWYDILRNTMCTLRHSGKQDSEAYRNLLAAWDRVREERDVGPALPERDWLALRNIVTHASAQLIALAAAGATDGVDWACTWTEYSKAKRRLLLHLPW